MIIAGIGSRTTPKSILSEMIHIGEWCRANKVAVRSGHAEGADWAFEQGAQENCIAYLPWATFNQHLQSRAHFIVPALTTELEHSVRKYHPAPNNLSPAAFKLMARNFCQIVGLDGSKLTNAVVCWTSDGKASGGTGHALRIAADPEYNIPVLNMHSEKFNTADKVCVVLKSMFDSSIIQI